jgi:hypothetical protein
LSSVIYFKSAPEIYVIDENPEKGIELFEKIITLHCLEQKNKLVNAAPDPPIIYSA